MTAVTPHDIEEPNRYIGDRLLAERWHARQLPPPGNPGARWTLTDPGRRIRLVMGYDLDGRFAEITAVHLPGSAHTSPLWKAWVTTGQPEAVLAAARQAAASPDPEEPGAARRALTRTMRASGWHPTASRIAAWAWADATWTSPERRTVVTFIARSRRGPGGWEIASAGSYAEAEPAVPAGVLLTLAGA